MRILLVLSVLLVFIISLSSCNNTVAPITSDYTSIANDLEISEVRDVEWATMKLATYLGYPELEHVFVEYVGTRDFKGMEAYIFFAGVDGEDRRTSLGYLVIPETGDIYSESFVGDEYCHKLSS